MSVAVGVGIIGAGYISAAYLTAARRFESLRVVAIADAAPERARSRAVEYDVPDAMAVEELLAHPGVEIVLNLTVPRAHAEISSAALDSGKHVYSEKPLALLMEDARGMLKKALDKGLRVGCAPDTFLGGAHQTCRALIDAGAIGEPVGATAFMMSHGNEHWHPDPGFFYQPGGGPMLDMGPYYLTALVNLIGPIARVTGSARVTSPERNVTSEPLFGTRIPVGVPTHVAGVVDFAGDAVGTIITSWDIWGSRLPHIEVYGTEGTLVVPDPNDFGGEVLLRPAGVKEWYTIEIEHPYVTNSRGLGLADMATALASGRPHRASGELALHVLETMCAFEEASVTGSHVTITSSCSRPAQLHADLPEGILDR